MPPKIAIVDANYKDQKFRGLAATWLSWELQQRGIQTVTPLEAEYLLISISSPKGYKDVKRALKNHWNGKAKRILGGGGCFAPAIFDPLVDCQCVGEGYDFLVTLIEDSYQAVLKRPETWVPGETRPVTPNMNFPWHMPPILNTDNIYRVFASRGCHNKCLFCQTGNAQTYRTNPNPDLLNRQVRNLRERGLKFALVTNDGADVPIQVDGPQEFVSANFKNLVKLQKEGRLIPRYFKQVRIGVEGVSERLRKAIGKPVPNDGLAELTIKANRDGVRVRWFFIAGLPGEEPEDWEELRALFRTTHHIEKSMIIAVFHSFIPEPSTPLGVLPLVDEYLPRYNSVITHYYRGMDFTGRIHFTAPGHYPTRLREAMENMCARESQLRRGWFDHLNPNWRVQYPLGPDKLRRMAKAYMRRLEQKGG